MEDTYIYHYGVKGMKWGVRRTAEQLGHKIKKKLRKKQNASITRASVKATNKSGKIGRKSLSERRQSQ